jgi:DNA-binding GntR family transcriptional regulator
MPPDEPSMPLVLNTGQHRAMTAHVFVRDTLREAIVSGALAGGTRLIQAELAAQLNVSNTPIREALRDLAGEGLVEFDPHRGSRVRLLQLDEAREIYEMRIALEPLMVRRAVSIVSSAQLDRAEQLCGRMERTTNLSRWSELNREFHSLLAVSDPTSRLAAVLSGLRDSSSMYVAMSLNTNENRLAESNAEHAKLLALYRARDIRGATAMTIGHLRATLTDIQQADRHLA